MRILLITIFSIGFLQACNYSDNKAASSPTGNNILTTQPDAKIDFNLIKTQMKVCLDCHSPTGTVMQKKPFLTTKQELMDSMNEVLSEVGSDSMPPTKKGYISFTACEKAALQKWYDLGAPDDSDVAVSTLPECMGTVPTPPPVVIPPPPPPPVAESMVDLAYIQMKTKVCLDCHSPNKKSPDLSSHQGLIDHASDILSEVMSDSMPPVKKGYASLTACEKAALQKWYDLGAPKESTTTVKSLPECIVVP